MHARITKGLVAVVATAALLTLTSPPAGAAGPFTFNGAIDGTLVIDSAGPYGDVVADWDTPYNPCNNGNVSPPDLRLMVGPAIFGTAQTQVLPALSAGWAYQDGGDILLGSLSVADPATVIGAADGGTISVNSPAPHTYSQEVWFLLDVVEVNNAPTCTSFTPVCQDLVLVFDDANTNPLVGDYTGTIPPTPTTTIADLGGVGAAFAYGPCDPDFVASFQAQPVTVTGLDLAYP